jgi:hypothetical protein
MLQPESILSPVIQTSPPSLTISSQISHGVSDVFSGVSRRNWRDHIHSILCFPHNSIFCWTHTLLWISVIHSSVHSDCHSDRIAQGWGAVLIIPSSRGSFQRHSNLAHPDTSWVFWDVAIISQLPGQINLYLVWQQTGEISPYICNSQHIQELNERSDELVCRFRKQVSYFSVWQMQFVLFRIALTNAELWRRMDQVSSVSD